MNAHHVQQDPRQCRDAHERESPHCREHSRRKHLLWGTALISAGAALLLDRHGLVDLESFFGPIANWWHFLPLVLAAEGLIDILGARGLSHVGHGIFNIIIGLWLYACLEHLWNWTFTNSWPTILVALGIAVMTGSLRHSRGKSNKEPTP